MITIVTPAETQSLITGPDAYEALDMGPEDAVAFVDALVIRASDVIARHCRRVFGKETVGEQLRLVRSQTEFMLSRYPIIDVVSIYEDDLLVAAADYEVDFSTGCIVRLRGDRPSLWTAGKIVVTYSAGYELPADAPPALAHACLQLVKSYYVGADRDPMMRSETVDQLSGASYFDADIPPDVRGLLTQFRNVRAR